MNRVLVILLAIFSYFLPATLSAQSSSIRLTGTSSARRIPQVSRSAQGLGLADSVSNSMPANWRHWETILNQVFAGRFQGERKMETVIDELRNLGLPVILDLSALDDSLVPDEIVELKLPDQTLGDRVDQALRERNACLVFRSDRILIISLDDADDSEFFMTITYDVSGMGINPESLLSVIQGSVQPDQWQDTGQGLGTIEHLMVRGKDLLVISQSYRIHKEVRALLNGFNRLTGTQSVRNRHSVYRRHPNQAPRSGGYRPVVAPRSGVFPQTNSTTSAG